MTGTSRRPMAGGASSPRCSVNTGSEGLPLRKTAMTEPKPADPKPDARKTTPPFTVAVYNPALLKKEDLIRGFVARQPLLERLLDDLRREAPGSTPQHHLIIGQRGLGKTTLLRRLAFAVEDDPAPAAAWMPLVFQIGREHV